MNIIYIAYSCNPYNGTEDKIGWNIPKVSSRYNNKVYIVTKAEGRNNIENELKKQGIANIQCCYVEIPNFYKKIFKGAFYSGRLNIWNKYALKQVKKICKKEKIDIIHQINPVEFRSIGNYGKIKGVSFVCGPLGGGEYIPEQLKKYVAKDILMEKIRLIANYYYKFKYKFNRRFASCDKLLFANHETMDFLGLKTSTNDDVITEIASNCPKEILNIEDGKISFLVAGRFVYRKGLDFLLDAIECIPADFKFIVYIAGDGPLFNKIKSRVQNSPQLNSRVIIIGKVDFQDMNKLYMKSSALIMPSLRETTGSVILEALENGIPVITYNGFGAKEILDEKTAYLYNYSQENVCKDLANAIIKCYEDISNGILKDEACLHRARELSFENKGINYQSIYENLLKRKFD